MKSRAGAIATMALLLLSLGLRAFRLDAQSLWYDEGNSARIAERSLRLIVEGAAGDIHPPLYYLLLAAWRLGAGESEYALRFLSLFAGVLTCALTYALAKRASGNGTAILALGLIAIHPFAVYYAQEARMYALLAMFAAASTVLLVQMPDRFNWRWAAAFGLVTAAGLYTQYAYPFVMLAQGLWIVLCMLFGRTGRHRSATVQFTAASALSLLLFAPWVQTAIRQVTTWPASVIYPRDNAFQNALAWLFAGRTLDATITSAANFALVAGLVFALIGLAAHWRRRNAWLTVLAASMPFVLMAVLGMFRDAYLKVLLMSVAPLVVLMAVGVRAASCAIGRLLRFRAGPGGAATATFSAALALALGFPSVASLNRIYFDPAYAKEDYRGIARTIESQWRPDDAVLFLAPNQWEVFTYYRRDETGLYPLKYRPANAAEARETVARASAGKRRVYGVYYAEQDADPAFHTRAALAEFFVTAHSEWRGNVRFEVHAPRAVQPPPGWLYREPITFGDDLTVISGAAPSQALQKGDIWSTRLVVTNPPKTPLKAFLHIGRAGQPPVAQADVLLGLEDFTGGALALAVWLPPGMPVGEYDVFVGFYDPDSGQRYAVKGAPTDDNRLKLATITVR